MAAVPGVVGPRLRGERGDEALPRRDGANRVAYEKLLVRGLQRGRVAGRDLLLSVAELRVVLLERDALRLECCGKLVDVVLRRGHADRREAERRVDRHVRAVHTRRERELVLECSPQNEPALREPRLHALQEAALAHRRGLAVEPDVVREHRPRVRRIGKDAERVEIGHEPDLTHRPHAFDGLQLVERAHRLHGDGEPDPALEPTLEPAARRRLPTHRAVVAAPEEADEAEARLVRLLDDVGRRRHAGVGVGVGCSRRCMYSLIA
jgi:hypothetical protein